MALNLGLRFNMTSGADTAKERTARYRAALDMAEYADQNGFDFLGTEEHHCAGNNWMPAPLILAAMLIARTQRIQVNVAALLVTLYDPVRLAEDIAVLDISSAGRFSFVAGIGYRDIEYHATGNDWAARGKKMDKVIATLLQAWSGEAFDYNGRSIKVTPQPVSTPRPFFFIGGQSKVAARRAARFGLPYYPSIDMPDIEAVYKEELNKHGQQGFVMQPGSANTMIVVDENPEQAWQELGPFFLNELREYSSWKMDGMRRPKDQPVDTINDLREQQRFSIFTPDDCVDYLAALPDGSSALLHPLAGGIPPDRAWQSLKLFVEQVKPRLV